MRLQVRSFQPDILEDMVHKMVSSTLKSSLCFFGQTLGSHMASLHKGTIQILTWEITLYLSSTQQNSFPTPYPCKSLSIYQHHLIDSNFDLLQIYINYIAWWHTWCNQTLIRDRYSKARLISQINNAWHSQSPSLFNYWFTLFVWL